MQKFIFSVSFLTLCMLCTALLLWSEWCMSVRACYLRQGLKFSLTHCVEGHRVFPYKLSYRLSNFPVVFWFAFVCSDSHKSPSYMATFFIQSHSLPMQVLHGAHWNSCLFLPDYFESVLLKGTNCMFAIWKLHSIKLQYWFENNF